ncbi:MAG: AraC family transcriptional regulator [Catonella sp.]|uniref:AraC family transcriptional regulator n=1 Tax=Catonella sp. TaxID=2382125 RepID=UPI003F9F96F8
MSQEYEFVRYSRLHHIKAFLNKIQYRNYHTHNAFEILFVLEGEAVLSLQNESVQLTPGKTVLINPYEPHEIQVGKGFMVGLFLQVSRHFCRDYFPYFSSITFEYQTFDDNIADLKDVIVKTALCYLEAKPLFEIELVSLVSNFLCLLIKHFKYYILDEHNHSIREKRNQRMKRITAYINDHYTESLRLSELAQMEQLTVTHISHLFKDYYGITFQDYLNNLRFEKAMTMILSTNLFQMEIALASGFSDAKYLSAIIKKGLDAA